MRERNGWVDSGKPIGSKKCWSCGSNNYIETLSREHCPDCGIECDYWGGGTNAAYDNALNAKHRHEDEAREKRIRDELRSEERDDESW